jgi:L-rhamnose mutarotase
MTREHAFKMQLKPGAAEEYRRRHDAIWPELASLLTAVGIGDYSIWLDEATGALFAIQHLAAGERTAELPQHPVMRRWWGHMADLMQTNPDGSPLVMPLTRVFHLD